ncbi:MAG: cytochrome c [Bryobacteraceae bacterium]
MNHWGWTTIALLVTGFCLPAAEAPAGKQIFESACAACHGADGRGAPQSSRGFKPPPTFPDFTACRATAREPDVFWSAIIHNGGPERGFSEIMPSFREVLTTDQVRSVIQYVRGFCRDNAWPRGDLNLPRPLFTEKAFPEDEAVVTSAIDAEGAGAVSNKIVYEKRLGARGQMEVVVPFSFKGRTSAGWAGGVGDTILGYKRVLAHSFRTGSIFSLAGETILPTGDAARGFGKGVTVFESFASYGQLLPKESFLQFQTGIELPTHDDANKAVFWRTTVGKHLRQGQGLGRMWAPMVELLADRELATGERINWDVVPQFQVTLSRRQHIRANFGVRVPVNDYGPRSTQFVFYLMWDWFDGGLRDGWK